MRLTVRTKSGMVAEKTAASERERGVENGRPTLQLQVQLENGIFVTTEPNTMKENHVFNIKRSFDYVQSKEKLIHKTVM